MNWIYIIIGIIILVFIVILYSKLNIKISNFVMFCDSCHYEETIDVEKHKLTDFSDLVGKSCPKCGYVMINHSDVVKLRKMVKYYKPNIKKSNKFLIKIRGRNVK